jgi:serine/threonine protein kinase
MAKPVPSFTRDHFDAFLREAHITARLDHPGIVKLFDMGIDGEGRPFFTMELKKGRSLREFLDAAKKGEEFPLRRRLSILLQVCEAVAYAHSQRVLHLDIKPENIHVGEFGEVQVCDWGMGVVIQAPEGGFNQSEILLDPDLYGPLLMHTRGTPGYMAPEQHDARQPKTPAMDVFALGCLLEELATLQLPDRQCHPERVPGAVLAAMVAKARHPSLESRYRSVEGFHRDLSRHVEGFSTTVESAGLLREMRLFYRRNRTACRLAAALGALTVMFTLITITQLRWGREQARQAQQVAEQAKAAHLAEKLRAEAVLRDYLAGKEEADRRLDERAALMFDLANGLTSPPFWDDRVLPKAVSQMQAGLNDVIALDPPPESPVWYQQFWLYFLSQDFAGALATHGRRLEEVGDLVPLAEEYAALMEGRRFLPASEFGRLMADLAQVEPAPGRGRTRLMERMLIYDQKFPRPAADRAAILRDVLAAINQQGAEIELDFDAARRALSIRGASVRLLSIPAPKGYEDHCQLRFLDPLELSVRGTGVKDLAQLSGLGLIELDIRETDVGSLLPLHRMRSLRRIVVSPGQFTAGQLAVLPDWVTVAAK